MPDLFEFKPSSSDRLRRIARSKSAKNKSVKEYKIGDSDSFSIENLVEKVMGRDASRPIDVVVDDSSMPEAPNYVTFLWDKRFLDIKAWARQMEIGTRLFSEWCPRCSDAEWFERPDRLKLAVPIRASYKEFNKHVVLLEHGKCPKCGNTKYDFMKKSDGRLPYYNELIGVIGQRGSKSAMVGMHSVYFIHQYLMMRRPTQMLGLLKSTVLHGTFVALTFDQARENLWDPIHNLISNSAWFQNYHSLLADHESKTGEKLFKFMDTFLVYRHRNLHFNPSGPNMKTLRGRTRLLCALDELGWMDNEAESTKVKMNAEQVYIALERSLMTCRAAAQNLLKRQRIWVPPALFQNVSSPSSRRDKIMMLLKDAETQNQMLGVHHPTWEINPNLPRNSDQMKAEYRKNPTDFMRDYGAEPPLSSNAFFDSPDLIGEACSTKRGNSCIVDQRKIERTDGSKFSFGSLIGCKTSGTRSILALDAGMSNNSFAFAIVQISPKTKKVEVPCVGEVIPRPGYPANFAKIYDEIIHPLIKRRNVCLIVADRWQSNKLLHDACEDFSGLQHKIYSLKYEDMVLVRDRIYDGSVRLPRPEMEIKQIIEFDPNNYPLSFTSKPVSHLLLQMLTVRDTGREILKGEGLTDDIWRAVALGSSFALDPEYQDMLNMTGQQQSQIATAGQVFGRSSGSSSSSGTSVGFISSRG